MLLDVGEVIHVVERRAFEGDVRRHFAGRVDRVDGPDLRVTGFVYAFNQGRRLFELREAPRTRVFSMRDARLIINVLPDTVDPGALLYRWEDDEHLLVTQKAWTMELTEFAWKSS